MRVRTLAAIAALCCCPPPLLAQALTHIQLLALQQQLRDDGCGVSHVTGRMDAMTRRAVKQCMSKYNVTSGGAAELLAAMRIGFSPGDPHPAMGAAGGGNVGGMPSDSTAAPGRRMRHMRNRPARRGGRQGGQRTPPSDSAAVQHADSMAPAPAPPPPADSSAHP